MMTSILTAMYLALAQLHNVVSALEQLQATIATTIVAAEDIQKQLDAIQQQVQDSAGSIPTSSTKRGNPFADIQEWHTAMAKLHTAYKQVIYWKRTRAQILEAPSDIVLPEPIFILMLFVFI